MKLIRFLFCLYPTCHVPSRSDSLRFLQRLIHPNIHLAAAITFGLIILSTCAARVKFSQGGLEHLTKAIRGRSAVLKETVTPQNRHGILLRYNIQPAGTELTVAEIVIAPGWKGISFMVEGGRTGYLPVEADDIPTFEAELSKLLRWLPEAGSDSAEADLWLKRTGHIHPPDHLVVIKSGTPLLAVPEIGSPIKATVKSGDRLAINIRDKTTLSDWFPVISEEGEHGWISAGLVYGPVYLHEPKDIAITKILPDDRNRENDLDELLIELINETDLKINAQNLSKWPWEVKAAVYHHRALVGMTSEMTRLSLGQPSRTEKTAGEELWYYDQPDDRNKVIRFRNGRIWQIEEPGL